MRSRIAKILVEPASVHGLCDEEETAVVLLGEDPMVLILFRDVSLAMARHLVPALARRTSSAIRPTRLERSRRPVRRVFTDVQDYARERRLPIGINVESVSIRKSEIDARWSYFGD